MVLLYAKLKKINNNNILFLASIVHKKSLPFVWRGFFCGLYFWKEAPQYFLLFFAKMLIYK
jgi:hypothetical protein